RNVEVSLEVSEDLELVMPSGGRVTENSCVDGSVISSGTVVAHVNGESVLALHTSIPLWETLVPGDIGPEVNALRQELNRMGADLLTEGPMNQAVIESVARFLADEEGDFEDLESVPVERIMWLPRQDVVATTCEVVVGLDVEKGDTYGTVQGELTAARIDEVPDDAISGPRALNVDGADVPLDADGNATLEGIAVIAASRDYLRLSNDTGGMEDAEPAETSIIATWVLRSPIQAWSVPAATVFDVSDGGGCVTDHSEIVPVKIVGSSLGATYVVPVEGATSLPANVVVPDARSSCEHANEAPTE
ncbi:hypothetical protein ACWGOE_14065, partial [Leucobacter chromiiresistens]